MDEHSKITCPKRHCWNETCQIHIKAGLYFCSSECQDEYWAGASDKPSTIYEAIDKARSRALGLRYEKAKDTGLSK